MSKYMAILFAPDGDWVVDFSANTKEEVVEKLANRGSLWLFYPFEGVITDRGMLVTSRQRLVDVAPNLPRELVGKRISTVSSYLKNLPEAELHALATGG